MSDASPDLSLAERIDTICDQFEQDFRAGRQPRIESCLGESQEPFRSTLLRAVVGLEIELRQKQGEKPQPEEYISRFPNHVDAIQQVFTEVRSILSSVKVSTAETSKGPAAVPVVSAVDSPSLRQLGRFQILSVLGEGAFGTVYKAHDPQLDRDVAVKVPRFNSLQNKDDRERFLREGRAAAGLHHPQICPVYEVGTIDGRDYIVMAFIDGKPLNKVLQSQANLSDKQVASVIRKVALGLQEAHDKGVIHRDLKPANIMINRKGEPVIMDFGLARRSNSADAQISQSGQIMGTPAYMSPEQARGDGKMVGPAADIYGLGVMFYELLCGRRPFEGTITEVLGQILHVDAEPPSQHRPGVDSRLETICLKAIAKKPSDRYASMTEFAAALTDYVKTGSTVQPTTAATAAEAPPEPALQTKQFAKLIAAVSSDLEDKVERAASRAVRNSHKPPKVPWWTYLVGSGLVGVIVLLGIFFFIRKDTVTVIVNIPIENIHDPSLSFILDNKAVAAEAFASPIELKPGEHELIVNKDGKEFKRFLFNVGKADNQPVIVQDVTPKAAGPDLAIAPFDAAQAKAHQEAWAKHLGVPVEYTNSIGMKFRLIPPGEFMMGMPEELETALLDAGADDYWKNLIRSEVPQHKVVLTQPIFLSAHEVTQAQYQQVVGQNPSSLSPLGWRKKDVAGMNTSSHPVEMVSWNSAAEFCAKLSEKEQLKPFYFRSRSETVNSLEGTGYRLPTEAEWEFACRAGTTTRFWTGNKTEDLVQVAWFDANAGNRTHAVGEFKANPLGLFDMHGNVAEWVQDSWDPKYYRQFQETPAINPAGPPSAGASRVVRGGGWYSPPSECRASNRQDLAPTARFHTIGFRVSLPVDAVKQALSQQVAGPRVELVSELQTPADETDCWISPDGLIMYFLREGSAVAQPGIYRTTRRDANSPFGNPQFVTAGRHVTLSADEKSLVVLQEGQGSEPILQARREDVNAAFSQPTPIPALSGDENLKSPWLSRDGRTLVYQRRDKSQTYPGKTVNEVHSEFAVCRRASVFDGWSAPERLPMRPDPSYTHLVWPMLTDDELTLFFGNGGTRWNTEIMYATRSTTQEPFGNMRRVTVDGKQVYGRSPRYIPETNELFFTWDPGSKDSPKDIGIYVIKNFKPELPSATNAGWVDLFNGKDLAGWKTHPSQPGGWTVENGLLTGRSDQQHHLFTERGDFESFHLRAEVKINHLGNSGIWFRSPFNLDRRISPDVQGTVPSGYHAMILEDFPRRQAGLTGTLRRDTQNLRAVTDPLIQPDQWFTLEILAEGQHLTVKVDGKITAEIDDPTYSRGHMALKARGEKETGVPAMVQFRKIAIKELPRQSDGWTDLFNGKDLTGWVVEGGDPKAWRAEQGELVVTGTGLNSRGWLLTERDYTDYELRFEFQLPDGANSGVALRAVPGEKVETPLGVYIHHLEVELYRGPSPQTQALLGTLLWSTGAGKDRLVGDQPAVLEPENSWNRMEIQSTGNSLRIVVNGRDVLRTDLSKVADRSNAWPGLKRSSGRLGFQCFTGTVRFRNIRIRELGEIIAVGKRANHDLDLMQGAWDVVAEEFNGVPTKAAEIEASKKTLRVNGNQFVISRVFMDGTTGAFTGRIQLDQQANPKQFDWTGTEPSGTLKDMLGLYELTGDTLKIVYNFPQGIAAKPPFGQVHPGNPRPTAFTTSGTGAGTVVSTFRRRSAENIATDLGWTDLFNGKDLAGWKIHLNDGKQPQTPWTVNVDRRVIVARALGQPGGGHSWLETEKTYDDFELSLEWRFPTGASISQNGSGIVVLANGLNSINFDPKGIEIDLRNNRNAEKNIGTGCLITYDIAVQGALATTPANGNGHLNTLKEPTVHLDGKWNTTVVSHRQGRLQVTLNGDLVNEATTTVKSGKICLRNQNTDVEFGSVKLSRSR